ncbi:MAG: thioredoxin family protein [Gammaproteobacteria bacterium]
MQPPRIATREDWLQARKSLLIKEKEATRALDRLRAERRALPWVKVDKAYEFDTREGPRTLADLFDGRSQLFVYHNMLTPDSDHICPGCSLLSDHFDAARQHFEHADLSLVVISRAKLDWIEQVRKRMGWRFQWVSSFGSDFNYDYRVSFTEQQIASGEVDYNFRLSPLSTKDLHGESVFARGDDGAVYHTYSSYGRGSELLVGAFNFLDLAPKGRNEKSTMSWVRLHDEYDDAPKSASCCSSG